jgi:radical SAM modification target selenobiotic family peptide
MMNKKEFKQILAGLSIAALLAGTALTMSGCATTGQGS